MIRLSPGQFLEHERLAKQNQLVLNDESDSQEAMGEEKKESDEAAAAYRFQKSPCTKVIRSHFPLTPREVKKALQHDRQRRDLFYEK